MAAKHNTGNTIATTENVSPGSDMWYFDKLPKVVRAVMRETVVGPIGARDVYTAIYEMKMPEAEVVRRLMAQANGIAKADWKKTFGEDYPCK